MPSGIYIRTKENIENIRESKIGIKNPMYKKDFSLEHRKKIGDAQRNKISKNWKGGKIKEARGYVLIHQPNHPFCMCKGYVREHRLVMEKYLNRYLKPKEVVHHINGILDDNRIENLELKENQSKHLTDDCPWRTKEEDK